MFVKHRPQQRMGLVEIPEKERKCIACKVVFKSKSGLFSHQARKSNPKCHRAGIHRMRADWVKGKLLHQNSWQLKKKVSRPVKFEFLFECKRGCVICKLSCAIWARPTFDLGKNSICCNFLLGTILSWRVCTLVDLASQYYVSIYLSVFFLQCSYR